MSIVIWTHSMPLARSTYLGCASNCFTLMKANLANRIALSAPWASIESFSLFRGHSLKVATFHRRALTAYGTSTSSIRGHITEIATYCSAATCIISPTLASMVPTIGTPLKSHSTQPSHC